MLKVVAVSFTSPDCVNYRFSDGSVGVWQIVKDQRGFIEAGPLDNLTAAQRLAVSQYNEQANKPDGGWL